MRLNLIPIIANIIMRRKQKKTEPFIPRISAWSFKSAKSVFGVLQTLIKTEFSIPARIVAQTGSTP